MPVWTSRYLTIWQPNHQKRFICVHLHAIVIKTESAAVLVGGLNLAEIFLLLHKRQCYFMIIYKIKSLKSNCCLNWIFPFILGGKYPEMTKNELYNTCWLCVHISCKIQRTYSLFSNALQCQRPKTLFRTLWHMDTALKVLCKQKSKFDDIYDNVALHISTTQRLWQNHMYYTNKHISHSHHSLCTMNL